MIAPSVSIFIQGDTMQGTVKYFDLTRGFGIIRASDGNESIIHFTDIQDEVKALATGEEVTFTQVEQSEDKTKAVMLTRQLQGILGKVLSYDFDKGMGKIKSDTDDAIYSVHYKEIACKPGEFITLEPEDYVEFLPAPDIGGLKKATRVIKLDHRKRLERFAKLDFF